jgi:hypothetical protein
MEVTIMLVTAERPHFRTSSQFVDGRLLGTYRQATLVSLGTAHNQKLTHYGHAPFLGSSASHQLQ